MENVKKGECSNCGEVKEIKFSNTYQAELCEKCFIELEFPFIKSKWAMGL